MRDRIIRTKYMPASDRIKATHSLGLRDSKYTKVDDSLPKDKMHEIAAYNLMVKMHISIEWKLDLLMFSNEAGLYTWRLVKR